MKRQRLRHRWWLAMLFMFVWQLAGAQQTLNSRAVQKSSSRAQTLKVDMANRCYTVPYMEKLRSRYSGMMNDEEFERWLAPKVEALRRAKQNGTYKKATYTIPVVVHVIHKGESVGSGTNIPFAQIESQIRVLNEDFNRLNADAANTPADFAGVASSIDIEFKLATRDPDGNPLVAEPGVHRVDATAEGWGSGPFSTSFIDNTIKPATSWDPTKYLNIWVCEISGGILGYAQFPEGSGLPGMPTGTQPANTDGVVILTQAFGSNYDASGNPIPSPFNLATGIDKGRTATHEVGHFFGLRHIWGDGDCSQDDFVSDTPLAGAENYTQLPCTYPGPNSCNTGSGDLPDMFQNYMDYSYDACMNLFTAGQVDRMETVLQNSPRRLELTTSDAADPLSIYANFTVDVSSGCAPLTVTFTDASGVSSGEPPITSWSWNFDLNSTGGTITPSATATGQGPHTITFDPTSLGVGVYTYTIELTVDNGNGNSTITKEVTVVVPPAAQALPQANGFEGGTVSGTGTINGWTVSTTGSVGWETTAAAAIEGTQSLRVRNYDEDLSGQTVELSTPLLDFTSVSLSKLEFYVAYAPYSSSFSFSDGLRVVARDVCTGQEIELYNKSGNDLATAPATTSAFVPTASQWRLESVDLSALSGLQVEIVFQNIGGYGNNIYIDDVQIKELILQADFTVDISSGCAPLTVTFTDASVVATGQPAITSWSWNFDLNSTGGTITPSATATGQGPHTITFDPTSLGVGVYTYTIELTVDNGNGNSTITKEVTVVVPPAAQALPQANGFEGGTVSGTGTINGWTVSTTATAGWETTTDAAIEGTQSLRVRNYDEDLSGQTVELESIPLDFSGVSAASLRFYVAYRGYGSIQNEGLRIVVRDPCTGSEQEVYAKYGSDLQTSPGTGNFTPTSASEWREEVVDLSSFAGQSGLVLVFQNIGKYGNNLYIDDVRIEEPAATDMAAIAALPKAWALSWSDVSFLAEVKNNGATPVSSFDITVDVLDAGSNSVFSTTETVNLSTPLNFGESSRVSITTPWTPAAAGNYTVNITVSITGDADASNDTYSYSLSVVEPNYQEGKVYAYNAYSGSAGLQDHYVTVDATTGSQSDLQLSAAPANLFGGDLVENVVLGISSGGKLYIVDEAGNEYEVAALTGSSIFTGLTYDGTQLFVSYVASGLDVALATVDMTTFELTPVGTIGSGLGIVGIAANASGDLYGISIVDDKLYQIDKTTAVPTEVGALGVDINYVQDIGFDRAQNVLYGTLYSSATSSGGLYTIDLSSGAATLIGSGFGDEELTMCAFVSSAPVVPSTYTVTFTVTDGSNPIENASISINNQTLTTDASGIASIDLPDGTYNYTVSAGPDYLEATGSVTVNGADESVTVTLSLNPLANEDLLRAGVEVYPNPVEGVLILNVSRAYRVRIMDLQGRVLVAFDSLNSQQRIDMSKYDKGLYIIELENEQGRHIGRIIKH
ncbi:MAG: hypothetical protein KatS3mg033_0538 [Thermonema sp.]|uniref:M43 family zinc metalloprotease n=1 Tax=Thermonema sp. TaxID=2231181 RepID=UPI0021DCAB69|nr:M43 family zinc metalloprotease [Thermonema sp.]GIV38738.1 MAG: hypothetical protein KatS3mg033_0538 [Thermonema sp.]